MGNGLVRGGRVAWSSSCSRNAHDQKNVLIRRAQSRINQATLPKVTSELGGII
jgi:hypothetical protein